ncbi:MAG: glycosyltransferase family 2 protein [Blastocatellia bacterium]|nr:glycosyltransferase family 2 protein [Blastocatellia bacterium]MCS7158552.1 glycosyltransferase family 2 protein [Blastocatellia bacterium]MDW8169323.1 glycosyltransferase family 2 protein [Acidobacteriota bacterium]MDW8257748.1 glycosyltransferase family 2 protein [Acidobacteriota bacterium]
MTSGKLTATLITSMYNAGPAVLEVIDRLFFPSLLRNGSTDKQLILLDDASPLSRQTLALVQKYEPEFRRAFGDYQFLQNPRNLGFGGSYNRGMRRADGQVLVILNDDLYLPEGSLDRLLEVLSEGPGVGLVGPVTNWVTAYQNTHLFPRIKDLSLEEQERIERFALRLRQRVGKRAIPVDRLIGFCLAISGDLVRTIGYLDESFAHGLFEDDDYCLRARRAGFRLLLDLSTFVYHGGPSGGGLSMRQNFPRTVKYAFRNGLRFARKHGLSYWAVLRQSLVGLVQFAFDKNTVTAQLEAYLRDGAGKNDA